MAYSDLLTDPRWQRKRLEILERDGWRCRDCEDDKSTLHVHHLWYPKGKAPWDVPSVILVTLCVKCHEEWGGAGRSGLESLGEEMAHVSSFATDPCGELACSISEAREEGLLAVGADLGEKDEHVFHSALVWAIRQKAVRDRFTLEYLEYLDLFVGRRVVA